MNREQTSQFPLFANGGGNERFSRMVVFSLLVHVFFSFAFLMMQRGSGGAPVVQYLDLKMMEPVAAPAEQAAPAVPAEKTPAPAEIQEEQPAPPAETAAEAAPPRQQGFQQASLQFGIANGHFGSISDGRTLRDDMREYYLSMLAQFNESWWEQKGKETVVQRGAVMMVTVSRDGAIVDMKLLQGSGNVAEDRLMVQALQAAGPLAPLPDSYEGDFFTAPLRFVPPLNLMAPFSG
ncbi:TonB C-terminal domain-containing protein [Geobacter sp. DSM 9736]|uniref:TonB C-terminal domain-containing protein n=1 Tax=Geobacter sp. DSM 9736 TaxID=1277350 RepID=UPI000B5026F9|nr:TonB C-terminal domain-containing protein [Geobacter sp. DSM 9736]SNB45962.1 protein TonB [Geobacter sp. DSM 9736]